MTTMIRKAVWGSSLLALVLALAPAASAQTLPVVTRVVDGDTIIVSGVCWVGLIGVDTPETVADPDGAEGRRQWRCRHAQFVEASN